MNDLEYNELIMFEGGSPISDAVCWFVGACFINPGKMARDGAAVHEILGFK